MACNFPKRAFLAPDGSVVWTDKVDTIREVELPCGDCMACRQLKAMQWSVRLEGEARDWKRLGFKTYFLTWTYGPGDVPANGSLCKEDAKRLCKTLRQKLRRVGYRRAKVFLVGEYGEKGSRPHYHALLFGARLEDLKLLKQDKEYPLYTSAFVEQMWGKGHVTIGIADVAKVGMYCAKYVLKKVNGKQSQVHYAVVDPSSGEIVAQREKEFMLCSKGLGKVNLLRYRHDYRDGFVTRRGGVKVPVPRYFKKVLKQVDADLHDEISVVMQSAVMREDVLEKSDERRATKEQFLRLKSKALSKRKL